MVEITAAEQNIGRRMKRNEDGLRNPLGQHQMHQHSHHRGPRRRRTWQPTTCSCLENPRDGGAWWAAVYGVTELDMTEAT